MEEQQQPSLPSNYVSFLQLKERWLQQHTPQSTHDSAPINQPKSPASKITNKSGRNGVSQQVTERDSGSNQPAGRNCNRELKPEVTMDDESSSKTTVVDNQKQQEQNTLQSKSKRSTKKKGPNPRFVIDPNQTAHSTPEPLKENKHRYKGGRRNWNPRLVTEKYRTGGSTPELELEPEPVQEEKLRDNGGHRKRNPRFVTDHNQTARSTPEPEPEPEPVREKKQHRYDGDRRNRNPSFPEPVPEKKQHGFNGGGRNRNPKFSTDQNQTGGSSPEKKHQRNRKQEVREPKGKTEPIAQDDYSGVVKEVNVRRNTNGRFQTNRPARPPFPRRKVQMTTAVWVKKGESVPN